ncbi:hypothetical protein RlegWSM1455_07175 [Rhizobium laguerreae]|uniref:hypothetical protein n=1 Tax=Rhizobium laguerreae TaxID=1076926 RepID=UPI001E2D4A8F|nr:hypothetical protein [Rhizobium laguerreae]UFW65796.1 hypothetical protein RlegWSM1455_07175 [Rhizobium laguerreae]
MNITNQITASLRRVLNDTFEVDYPRCNFWVSVLDADFLPYPMVILTGIEDKPQPSYST